MHASTQVPLEFISATLPANPTAQVTGFLLGIPKNLRTCGSLQQTSSHQKNTGQALSP